MAGEGLEGSEVGKKVKLRQEFVFLMFDNYVHFNTLLLLHPHLMSTSLLLILRFTPVSLLIYHFAKRLCGGVKVKW